MAEKNNWDFYCDLSQSICGLLAIVFRCILAAIIAFYLFDAIKYLGVQSPEHLSGFAAIAEKFNAGTAFSVTVNVVFWPILWYKERKGKKRAIRTVGILRRELEGNDPQRSSSGLTPTGDNP